MFSIKRKIIIIDVLLPFTHQNLFGTKEHGNLKLWPDLGREMGPSLTLRGPAKFNS
jgi:hypothetical protein